VLKNHSTIKPNSIKFTKSSVGEDYKVDFTFDASYECIITFYYCATECRTAPSSPLVFVPKAQGSQMDQEVQPLDEFKFSAGLE
jgi:hypothetical protein